MKVKTQLLLLLTYASTALSAFKPNLRSTNALPYINATEFQGVGNNRIKGISWFGLETEHAGFMCDWTHPISWHVEKIVSLGFNSIRVPFSHWYVNQGDWSKLDEFMEEVKKYDDLSVVLDFHRIDNDHQSAEPHNCHCTFDHFIQTWITVLDRYKYNSHLHAVDIFNEFQATNDGLWNAMARQIVQSIEAAFPNRFIYLVQGIVWGGIIRGTHLDDLPYPERIYYVAHKYFFSSPGPDTSYEQDWNWSIVENHPEHTHIIIGEYGFISSDEAQTNWFKRFTGWLTNARIYNTYFWSWNFNSWDTGGILKEDCTTVDELKMSLLNHYWSS